MAGHDAKTATRPGVADTQRLRFLLSGILAGVYFTLVLIMALFPAGLAAVLAGGIVSNGMAAALVMILLVFAVMGAFVTWIDSRSSNRS